jgi:hypothetical protein
MGHTSGHKRSIKIGTYLKNAVGNAKIFVTNRFTSMLPTGGASNLISSFVDLGLNKVSNNQAKVASKILKKSPFEISDSPEQSIKTDPMGFSHIQYPADLTGDELGHYMLFFTLNNNMAYDLSGVEQDLQFSADLDIDTGIKYTSAFGLGNTTGRRWNHHVSDKGKGYSASENQAHFRAQYGKGVVDQVKLTNTVTSAVPRNQIVTSAIALYMPPNVKVSYKAGWGEEATEMAGDIANTVKEMMGAKSVAEGAGKFVTGVTGGLTAYIKKIGGGVTEALGGGDPFKLVSKMLGVAVNPRQEMYYEGPKFREFDYEFKFWPRNADETDRVQKIIKLFKYHMHPAMDVLSGGRNFRIPSEFEIHYMCRAGVNDKLNRISRCALQGCDVKYGPDEGNYKTFEDNSPVAYTMTLSFKELEFMTKATIAKGM